MKLFNKISFIVLGIASLCSLAGLAWAANDDSVSVLYVPLIGITSVPDSLVLPGSSGNVTYNYAVKNFISQLPLSDIQVVDDHCSPVVFVEGDDNQDAKLDYSETWRYKCTANLTATTQSIATATGIADNLTATHRAYTTVIVGSSNLPPLVSIVNITKVAYPLSLPTEGGGITYTYKVTNPGIIALNNVTVVDDGCPAMSNKLGDTNNNDFLDGNEVWMYTCSTTINKTTTNTATVTAYANDLKAMSQATLTVAVVNPNTNLFDVAITPATTENIDIAKIIIWLALAGILVVLLVYSFLIRKKK